MGDKLRGKRVAFLAADGVEQVELEQPWEAVKDEGGEPVLLSINERKVRAFQHLEKGDEFDVDQPVSQASADEFDGLVLPGGVANPDFLRQDEQAVQFARDFALAGKPIASICHGPWLLVEAGVLKGRTVTSFPSLKTDIENAGGDWVDEEVVVDQGLVTSRNPGDLDAFCDKLVEELCEGVHKEQAAQARQALGQR